MAVNVAADATFFGFSARRALFDWPYLFNTAGHPYDVSQDAQRFLVLKTLDQEQESTARQIIITEHWLEELQQLVPGQ